MNNKQYQRVLGLVEQVVGCASRICYNGYDEYDICDVVIMLCLSKDNQNRWLVKLTNPKNYHEAAGFAETLEQALKSLLEIVEENKKDELFSE